MARKNTLAFFTDFNDQSEENEHLEIVIPEDLSAVADEELSALLDQSIATFNEVYGEGKDLDAETLSVLETLTEGIEVLRGEQEARNAAAAEREEAAASLAARVTIDVEDNEPVVDVEQIDETPMDEEMASDEVEELQSEKEETLVASGRKEIVINTRGLRSQRQVVKEAATPAESNDRRAKMLAGQGLTGFASGQQVDLSQVAKGLDQRLQTFNSTAYETAASRGRQIRETHNLALLQKPFEENLIIKNNDPNHVEEVLAYATDESRLSGGSLVASGGWCAPSETLYDLFTLESRDGLISLPEVNVARGGISFTPGPDFASIYADSGFYYTEAEVAAGDYDGEGGGSKPCFEAPCPEFEEVRLDVAGVCITGGLLQRRGYPELIARTVSGALIAHDHRVSANIVNQLVDGSTAVTLADPQAGATAPILSAIELQATHYREVHRMPFNSTLEAIFPHWVYGAIRSDLSRRLGVDMISVPNARVNEWFAQRGISPQFIYNWQNLATTGASGFVAWPEEIQFLLYAAGTWVKGGADVVTLDTVYDSVNLGLNQYTALFTEEGFLVAKRGHDSRLVTVPINAGGATHEGVFIEHDGTFATA